MQTVAVYTLPNKSTVQFEVDPKVVGDGYSQASTVGAVSGQLLSLDQALNPIIEMLDSVVKRFRDTVGSPASIDVAIGLKIGAEGNFIVAKGSVEGNISVTLKYSAT